MAKKIRKIFTMILAICICSCMIVPQALAAEITSETTTEGGITTTVTTTKDTVENGDASVATETVETTKTGTDENGFDVSYEEKVTTTTTTEADGTVTETTVTDGSETKEFKGDVEVGDENQPEVEVELIPGKETSNDGKFEGTETTGDVPADANDTDYDYTESEVVIDKEVTAETGDVEIEVTESEADIESIKPEDYDDKFYSYDEGLISGLNPTTNMGTASTIPQPEADGYDFQWTGYGDATNACRAQVGYVEYLRDDEGNVKLDADGNPIVKSVTFTDKYQDGMGSTPAMFALTTYDEEGNIETHYYAYCIDSDTGANPGAWYRISNLEDSDYYPSEDSANQLRAVVSNGYWGTESGTGSYTQMRDKILAYYGADAEITVEDASGNPVTYTIAEVLEIMTEADALTMTQAAIWSYSNGAIATRDGEDGMSVLGVYSVDKPNPKLANVDRDYNTKRDALLKAGYEWLISLPGMSAPESTVVINENNFLEDATLVVGDKVDEVESTDADGNVVTDGVYETSVSFALGFTPGENDDLLLELKYTDSDAKEVTVIKRIAGENAEGEDYETITADANGKYTINGLKLTENRVFNFDLTLKGTQTLNEGVYVYQSYVSEDHPESQTMVGIASGTQDVTVNASMEISFSVEESKEESVSHKWHSESDPIVTPPEEPETPPTVPTTPPEEVYIPEEDVPETVLELDGEVILDEEVPLADVPYTGDNSVMWLALCVAVMIGLVIVNLSNKKRTEA